MDIQPFITRVSIDWDAVPSGDYIQGIPALHFDRPIEFTTPVTLFVGENGSGKSTLLESMAVAFGLNAEGSRFSSSCCPPRTKPRHRRLKKLRASRARASTIRAYDGEPIPPSGAPNQSSIMWRAIDARPGSSTSPVSTARASSARVNQRAEATSSWSTRASVVRA